MFFWFAVLAIAALAVVRFVYMTSGPGVSPETRQYHAANARWGFVIATVIALVVCFVISCFEDRDAKDFSSPVPIKAIGSTMQTSGHYSSLFFVASGSVDSEPVYYYFRAKGDGFILDHAPADETTLIESDSETPGIRRTCTTQKASHWMPFAPGGTSCSPIEYTALDIVVPKGSIIADSYKVGLPK